MATKTRASRGGAVFLFMMGLFLLFLGGGFCWLLWAGFSKASATRSWIETPAKILESRVEVRHRLGANTEFRWDVAYEYTHDGAEFVSKLDTPRGAKWTQHRKAVEQSVADFPQGSETVCFFNPEMPEVAILKHDSKAAGYSVWFPALFAIGGLGIMFGATKSFLAASSGSD